MPTTKKRRPKRYILTVGGTHVTDFRTVRAAVEESRKYAKGLSYHVWDDSTEAIKARGVVGSARATALRNTPVAPFWWHADTTTGKDRAQGFAQTLGAAVSAARRVKGAYTLTVYSVAEPAGGATARRREVVRVATIQNKVGRHWKTSQAIR